MDIFTFKWEAAYLHLSGKGYIYIEVGRDIINLHGKEIFTFMWEGIYLHLSEKGYIYI